MSEKITKVRDEKQLEAIQRCCNIRERIVPVTGPAGTGKTDIIKEVYDTLVQHGYTVALAAPTGKAAKRIQEATGIPAMTLHRLLEYPHPGERDPVTGKALLTTVPKRDKKNPLSYKVIICDEYAMVNHEVHRNLIDALPPGGCLRMFGDSNQLKPIERWQIKLEPPFKVALEKFNGVRLDKIYRQGEGSGIVENGRAIILGRPPRRRDDFVIKVTNQPVNDLEFMCCELLADEGINFGALENQVIVPEKKTWVGTYKLNKMLQAVFNPTPEGGRISLPRHEWDKRNSVAVGVGDKVIWTENSYDLRDYPDRYESEIIGEDEHGVIERKTFIPVPPNKYILNGESGLIVDIDKKSGDLRIDVGDRIVDVPHQYLELSQKSNQLITVDPRTRIDLAYAITTHKSQGSEYKRVIYVLNKSSRFMQDRHNLYTAVTRAREKVYFITDQLSYQYSATAVKE